MDFIVFIIGFLLGGLVLYVVFVPKLQKQNIKLSTTLNLQKEKINFISNTKDEFKTLADEILSKDKEKLASKNTQSIEPLKDEIKSFRKRMETITKEQSDDRSALKSQIEVLANLSKNTIKGTEKLTNALTYDNKQQGDWGEMVLENILQSSGLVKDKQYHTQKSFKNDDGKKYKPDVVVHLPDDKDIIIDSKVSLKAYQNYVDSSEEVELAEHIKSIERHIKDISLKGYANLHGINTLDYIFVFFPIEASLLLALEQKPDLFNAAIKKNVALVSPSTLMMSLKIVHHIWQSEKQNKNTEEIARLAGNMYDKLVGFVESLDYLESQLKSATKSYDIAKSRLSDGKGNVFSIASKIKDLGVRSKKELKI